MVGEANHQLRGFSFHYFSEPKMKGCNTFFSVTDFKQIFCFPHIRHSPISVIMNYQSANQLFSASFNALPSHSVHIPVSGHGMAQLLQASQFAISQERAKQMGAITERLVSHIISQLHREKLVIAPLVLEDGSQEMPYAELWPQDVHKVNAATRCL
jgi:hypothetical protein